MSRSEPGYSGAMSTHDSSPAAGMARLRVALELHEAGTEMKRLQLRRENPGAEEAEIQRLLAAWMSHRPGAEFGDGEGRPVPWPRR